MSNNANNNLTAGFIDLASYDALEKYMYGGPDATAYFVRETRKSTWFTQCPVTLAKCNGTPEFGSEWSCSISRAGDYLLGTWLHVVTPAVSLKVGGPSLCLAWAPNFMHALVKECSITFNDLVAASFTGTHLDFWAAFTTPTSKAAGYAQMIGAACPSLGSSLPSMRLNLPLPFFFSRDSGVALPTAALPYNEMRIAFKFAKIEEMLMAFENPQPTMTTDSTLCLPSKATEPAKVPPNNDAQYNIVNQMLDFPGNPGVGLAGRVPYSKIQLNREPSLGSNAVQVWANYAIVSNEERKRMACAPRDILIEQMQAIPTHVVQQQYSATVSGAATVMGAGAVAKNQSQSRTLSADIRFSHAVKVLFFALKNMSNPAVHSNYTTGMPVMRSAPGGGFCVANCGLSSRYDRVDNSVAGIAYSDAGRPSSQSVTATEDASSAGGSTQFGITTAISCLELGCCNAKDPVARASLVYENTARLGLMSNDYYSHVQPYYHAPAIPHASHQNSSTWCQSGVHMYSYSLDFICLDPLGSTNYGKLTNVQINVETEKNLGGCGAEDAKLLANGNSGASAAQVNSGEFNMSHASMVETLYLTNNYSSSSVDSSAKLGQKASLNLDIEVPYALHLTAVNNNIIRISGGALGFPVL